MVEFYKRVVAATVGTLLALGFAALLYELYLLDQGLGGL